jgi:hypothetical protein
MSQKKINSKDEFLPQTSNLKNYSKTPDFPNQRLPPGAWSYARMRRLDSTLMRMASLGFPLTAPKLTRLAP